MVAGSVHRRDAAPQTRAARQPPRRQDPRHRSQSCSRQQANQGHHQNMGQKKTDSPPFAPTQKLHSALRTAQALDAQSPKKQTNQTKRRQITTAYANSAKPHFKKICPKTNTLVCIKPSFQRRRPSNHKSAAAKIKNKATKCKPSARTDSDKTFILIQCAKAQDARPKACQYRSPACATDPTIQVRDVTFRF